MNSLNCAIDWIKLIGFIKTQGKLINRSTTLTDKILFNMCIRTTFKLDWIMFVDCLLFFFLVSCFFAFLLHSEFLAHDQRNKREKKMWEWKVRLCNGVLNFKKLYKCFNFEKFCSGSKTVGIDLWKLWVKLSRTLTS